MVDVGRARRLSKRIGTIVASAIEFEIKDPPLAFVTVTDTKVTGDLHDATVFYTVRGATLQDEPDYAGAAAALERAKGTLRTKVGAGTGVRFTPTLSFVLDKVPDTAAHMEELLAAARAADADLARIREGKQPVGDPNPYREAPGESGADDSGDGEQTGD
ncbi:30S ribosome-binding factor RbfA [Mycolicibacter arupensis]|uniref:Ribosome-binding factor A n=1 Tax=Mycolicibacter arupensis TaxID=342002 RepID=A0A0F5MY41_9MYCO|nr:30S ribosome-binding factor RbfA [Mycolicibacter arupensis]KKB99524.1 ribosome-binding factor A [Mycolicibacter arupensis]MCV7277519.1 30S ribosome-binding factor RbfA [Mycolicibacter arupensis]OQZ94540.1 ribosome-binding factor A [Mycolicibacter arupensis]TXI52417.1 MAG: 30S ribosome-binding factor RbfA [Mycolicibacter arupensis]